MNQPDSASNPDEREDLDEWWNCLKQIEPPLETRIANRDAVASALARASRKVRAQRVPVWLRTVTIPWPVAAATLAMLLGLSASHVRRNAKWNEITSQSQVIAEDASELPTEGATAQDTTRRASQQSMTYLCGIGTLRTETKFFSMELD